MRMIVFFILRYILSWALSYLVSLDYYINQNVKALNVGCEINRDTYIELQEDLAQIEQNRNQSIDRTPNNPIRT